MERETFNLDNHTEVNQVPYTEETTKSQEEISLLKEKDQALRLKDQHIEDLQSQLDALMGITGGGNTSPETDIDDELTRLKRSVSALLEKLHQLRRKHVDELAVLQKELDALKKDRAFAPTYHAEAQKVLHERLESLALRVDELQAQSVLKRSVVIVTSEEDAQVLKDATILRCMFEMKTDVLNRCVANEGIPKEQRETAKASLHSHWVGESYLIQQLKMRLLWYNMAHDALYKKLNNK